MSYYCSECKKDISSQEFFYSMNRFKKALCRDHQRNAAASGTTKALQELVRERHKDELVMERPKLVSVKDWIAADFATWDAAIKGEGAEGFMVKGSEAEEKSRDVKRSKK